jgi:hypothetical protein
VRSSCLRSRSVVVGADHTRPRSAPSASRSFAFGGGEGAGALLLAQGELGLGGRGDPCGRRSIASAGRGDSERSARATAGRPVRTVHEKTPLACADVQDRSACLSRRQAGRVGVQGAPSSGARRRRALAADG